MLSDLLGESKVTQLQITCVLQDHASVHDDLVRHHRWPGVVAFRIIPTFADGKTTAQLKAESGKRRLGITI